MQTARAQNVELRAWDSADWPLLYGWCSQYWNSVCTDDEPRNEDAFIELKRLQASPPGSITLGVYRDGRLGGLLLSVPVGSHVAQAHCYFRKGHTKEDSFFGPDVTVPALQMGMEFAWKVGYRRLDCVIFKHNMRMKRLLEAVGGVYEGTLRNRAWQHGEPIDMESWALFSPDNQPPRQED